MPGFEAWLEIFLSSFIAVLSSRISRLVFPLVGKSALELAFAISFPRMRNRSWAFRGGKVIYIIAAMVASYS